jgi:hypothetical protein
MEQEKEDQFKYTASPESKSSEMKTPLESTNGAHYVKQVRRS